MPAIHQRRERVAALLGAELDQEFDPDDIPAMVASARGGLREHFLGAGAGLTGANALVAETGSIMLVTNEGNARLATSLPGVHFVTAGIEKLVPTWADAQRQLQLLPRSATAQQLSTYTTCITGAQPGQGDAHPAARQRASPDGGGSADRVGAALHSLWGVRERLPAVCGGWRTRVRAHLYGCDRAGEHAVPPQSGGGGGAAEPVCVVRGVRAGVPGGYSAAGPDSAAAEPADACAVMGADGFAGVVAALGVSAADGVGSVGLAGVTARTAADAASLAQRAADPPAHGAGANSWARDRRGDRGDGCERSRCGPVPAVSDRRAAARRGRRVRAAAGGSGREGCMCQPTSIAAACRRSTRAIGRRHGGWRGKASRRWSRGGSGTS